MRAFIATAPLLALAASAYPTPSSSFSWKSIQNAWTKGLSTATKSADSFGWSDLAGLEDVFEAPQKSVWQWLVNDKE